MAGLATQMLGAMFWHETLKNVFCHGTGHPMMFKILSKGVFFVVRLGVGGCCDLENPHQLVYSSSNLGKPDLHIPESICRYVGQPWFVQDFKSFLCRNESKPTVNNPESMKLVHAGKTVTALMYQSFLGIQAAWRFTNHCSKTNQH